MKKIFIAILIALLTPASGIAAEIWTADVEIDPTAYVLEGYSLHAGFAKSHFRFDLGAFSMTMPEALHKQNGFQVGFHGFGIKAQYFFNEQQNGGFVGAGTGLNRVRITEKKTQTSVERAQLGAGVQGGWRFSLPANFYLTAWLGIDYAFNAKDFHFGGKTFDNNPLTLFPAVHVGYRF